MSSSVPVLAAQFAEIKKRGEDYVIIVAEDPTSGTIVGTATLLIEYKFIRGAGKIGHIEDVVVDAAARGQRLGAKLVEKLTERAKAAGAYKIILDCSESNVAFYEKIGLTKKDVQMVQYFI